jgi:hypothetical protein
MTEDTIRLSPAHQQFELRTFVILSKATPGAIALGAWQSSELFFHLSTVVLPVGFSKLTDSLKYI